VFAVTTEQSLASVGATIDGHAFTLDAQDEGTYIRTEIWSCRLPAAVAGSAIIVDLGDRYFTAIVAGMFTGLAAGVAQSSATANFGDTTDPDSGLAALGAAVPQAHYGAIGTYGRFNDQIGTWQNGMSEGLHVGFPGTHSYVKDGYRCLVTAAQARAQVIAQLSRPSNALVVCYR
jgi:hypothetical protein